MGLILSARSRFSLQNTQKFFHLIRFKATDTPRTAMANTRSALLKMVKIPFRGYMLPLREVRDLGMKRRRIVSDSSEVGMIYERRNQLLKSIKRSEGLRKEIVEFFNCSNHLSD